YVLTTHSRLVPEKPSAVWMCGRATLTMVASSTTISWAVAMTSRATPRWRPPRRARVVSSTENVVAMTPMLADGRPAVVARRKRLLAGQRGCRGTPGYSAWSSPRSLPVADALDPATAALPPVGDALDRARRACLRSVAWRHGLSHAGGQWLRGIEPVPG